MTTPEMHVMFRQYAQQMGMQNVRAILPEQIDLLLNTSVMDNINQIIKENIGVTNYRVVTDNSKLGQINALRSLYKVKLIDMSPSATSVSNCPFLFSASDRLSGRMTTEYSTSNSIPNYMFLVDFSISYKEAASGSGYVGSTTSYTAPSFKIDGLETNYFPVRLIDDAFLADTLNDFILKPRLRSPIMVTYNKVGTSDSKNVFDIYIDKFTKNTQSKYTLDHNLIPYKLRMSYIGKPAKIEYREDVAGTNQDCDLPEYMHDDIVKHAVDLYRAAVSGSLMAQQGQEQQARQEAMRNNYRNEGGIQ
ncbi:MAG: hypothetical protein [crAssphage sp. isolate ctcc615]|uniref:Uncharacterized protein n=1 Tax=crAssphage sp. isolate ctcc615 TaxID=2989853 RepID=A0A345BNY2_9CAUD|nr:MAG: hypothetical protein KNU00_gp60 [crAssphage sp. isolate ctcc615]AXF52153.1 MAG: hypothetical protein [crAssphage sp. isolate ctcc615]